MKHVANWALNAAATARRQLCGRARGGAAQPRADDQKRQIGSASDAESVGMSVRVIADGAWGFAASAELGRGAVEATAARGGGDREGFGAGEAGRCAAGSGEAGGAEWSTPYRDRSLYSFG